MLLLETALFSSKILIVKFSKDSYVHFVPLGTILSKANVWQSTLSAELTMIKPANVQAVTQVTLYKLVNAQLEAPSILIVKTSKDLPAQFVSEGTSSIKALSSVSKSTRYAGLIMM